MVRNVSQPKIREDTKGDDDVFRLSLTDGHTSLSAIVMENIKGINTDTPPGTKLLITGRVPIEGGFAILTHSNISVIGGRVEKLVEKWTIERRSLLDGERTNRSDGKAPKWVSFGKVRDALRGSVCHVVYKLFCSREYRKQQKLQQTISKQMMS
ncbi:unnamed protein product [Strongylus vulgaris]|uniref:RecQ mediated genome instability protein 1 OB-fold domain-containing protein n=1 Tax=Strongylus vulgaris TaxID=40348 RepID=A0A3P7JEM2_STRVU|nr:unnamed protein product [Strongylus vulgaris]